MSRARWILAAALAVACTPTSTLGPYPSDAGDTDAPGADAPGADARPADDAGDVVTPTQDTGGDLVTADTATDVAADTATDNGVVIVTDAPGDAHVDVTPDAPVGPAIAWGARCNTRADACAAPAGETGRCSTVRGTPVCMHTCNGQPAFTMCEGNRGVCVDGQDGSRYCLPKCGDADRTACGAGAACAWLGYRDRRDVDAGFSPIGVCLGSCTASGADACMGAGRACNPTTRTCEAVDCEGMCPAGTTCNSGLCNPPTSAALYTSCNPAPSATVVCSQNYCIGNTAAMSGFCTQACDSVSSALSCGTGTCYFGLNVEATSADAAVIGYWDVAFNVIGGRLSGVCTRGCATAADCPTGFTCQGYNGARACIPYGIADATTTTGAGLPGSVCRANTDCATNNCLLFPGYRDGLCARANLTSPCPAGTSVLNTAAGAPSLGCARACSRDRDNDCTGSWRCSTDNLCASLGCRSNTDCTTGYTCDVASNRCVTAPLPGLNTTGAPCTANASCASDFCLTEAANPDGGAAVWPGGYCSTPCTGLPGGGDTCPAGTFCSVHNVGALGACLKLCDAAAGVARFGSCRAGYRCQAFSSEPRVGVCLNN